MKKKRAAGGAGHFARADSALFGSASSEWYTPLELARDIARFLGGIDLDPCADPMHSIPARQHVSADIGDGLQVAWSGNVFVNPPYGRGAEQWTRKFVSDDAMAQGILLIPARTETRWFAPLWEYPICFIRGRVRYRHPTLDAKEPPFPSCLVYRGERRAEFAHAFSTYGPVVQQVESIRPRLVTLWETSA